MSMQPAEEHIKLWRIPNLPNIELMRATYIRQSFARHTHEGFAVGVIERGALGFFYRGENVVAACGSVNLANPDEAHTGHAAVPEGWTYRMFYLHADELQNAACHVAGRKAQMPFFQSGVLQDDYLAGIIRHTHVSLEDEHSSILEKESRILLLLPEEHRCGSHSSMSDRNPGT